MAKSSKLEDYWRENNIESLLKEVTQTLAQRMPSDPAVAIVQHLQKKYPKSFKTSTDNNNTSSASKTTTNILRSQSIISPRSDNNIENISDVQIRRRTSNQSQVSGIVTIPTIGSAFTNLLNQDADSSRQAPEISVRNLIFANRLSQQAVKLGKDIQSDHEILEEELIKPTKIKANGSSTTNTYIPLTSEDSLHAETHDEPSVKQIIRYKQNIRTENDRRLHREKLAELAKQVNVKEQSLQPDLLTKPDEVQQLQKSDDDQTLFNVPPVKSVIKSSHVPIARSKEEEEILNDENIFQPRRQREKYRNKLSTSQSNTPYPRRQSIGDMGSTGRREDGKFMQSGVCKVCGNIMNNEDNQLASYSRKDSAVLSARSFEPEPLTHSVKTSLGVVDDWFESVPDVSGSKQVLPRTPDDITPQPTDTNSFLQNLFQSIKDNNTNIVQHRPPSASLTLVGDATKARRSTTPRVSESDIFARTPESKIHPPLSRNIPSPVTKKHPTDTLAATSPQLSKPTAHSSSPTTVPSTERRMSGWSVRERSPDNSNEN